MQVGDTVTFYRTPRLSRWQRLMVKLGLRPPPAKVLASGKITSVSHSDPKPND